MEFVPTALFFAVFFGMAIVQAMRKQWRRAIASLLTSCIGPLALAIVLLHQKEAVRLQTQHLEPQIYQTGEPEP